MDYMSSSRSGALSALPTSTCKAHYWGITHCPLHRTIHRPPPNGDFILFPKLAPELRRIVWRFALPTTQRIVHVQQKLIDHETDTWFAEQTRLTRIWEDGNGEMRRLDLGTDAYGTKHVQGQLEAFGFTSSQPTPMLDSHERYTGYEHFRDHLDDRWLYSTCHSDVENLAQTCRESREVVKTRYDLAFSNRFGPARTWFDFETDVLYLSCDKSFFLRGFVGQSRSPFNLSIFDLRDLYRVKQLAVQYPRTYCRQGHDLEEAVRYAKYLDHLYLVEGDWSESDRSDLRLVQFDHSARGFQYMYSSWDDREKVDKYLLDAGLYDSVYDTWMESVETDLNEFYDECAEKGEPLFNVPNIELVSVVGARDYLYMFYWTRYIHRPDKAKKICIDELRLEDETQKQLAKALSKPEAELEHEESKCGPANDEYWNAADTVSRKKTKGTILDYFYQLEPWEAQIMTGRAVAMEAPRGEDEWEAEWKVLSELEDQHEVEEAYEAELEIGRMALETRQEFQ